MLTDDEIDRITDVQWLANNHEPIYAAHRAYARAIEAAIAAAPQGEWVMVPREPTEAMCKAGWTPEDPTPVGIWALMIAAAPASAAQPSAEPTLVQAAWDALRALEDVDECEMADGGVIYFGDEITALRRALDAPEAKGGGR